MAARGSSSLVYKWTRNSGQLNSAGALQRLLPRQRTKWRCYSSQQGTAPPNIRPGRLRRVIVFSAFGVLCTSAGFAVATAPAIVSIVTLMSAPNDAESVAMYKNPDEAAAKINETMVSHPLSARLRANPSFIESRPHVAYPEAHKKHSLTAGTLLGPGKVPVPPIVFASDKEVISISYLGTDLCGHVGMVHGGMLATMMDEGLARAAFIDLPNHIGVTASLTIKYKKPTPAGSFVLLRAATTKAEGRKAWVRGTLELLSETGEPNEVLVEAEGLFVEPKYAKLLPRFAA